MIHEKSTPKANPQGNSGASVARLSLKVPVALRRRIEKEAKREKRTLMAQATVLLERGLAAEAEAN